MKRFIFLFTLGALMIIGGQIALSLGLHPERLASLRFLVQSSLGLILGSGVIASGMLGMAEGYERIADSATRLLGIKQMDQSLELDVKDRASLDANSRHFWKAYARSALAVCLFLAGFLALSIIMLKFGYYLYLAGLAGSIAVLGILALLLGTRSLRAVRRTYCRVERASQVLEDQPDRSSEPPETPQSRSGWTRPRQSRYTRQLDTRKRSSPLVKR